MVGSDISVNIRAIAVGGAGVGDVTEQHDGRSNLLGITAFVPFANVGELVKARVVQQKDRYLQTELVEVIKESSTRVAPRCQYFYSCGGCELQQMSYEEQLDAKLDMITGSMRAGRIPASDISKVKPLYPSDAYEYRRKITLHIDSQGKVGFYRANSRSVVAIESCAIAVAAISKLLVKIQDFGREVAGRITSVILDADGAGVVAVMKSPYDIGSGEQLGLLNIAKKYFGDCLLIVGEKDAGGFGRQIVELPVQPGRELVLQIPAGNFAQANQAVNIALVDQVLSFLAPALRGGRILDLYSGAGNFSLPLAKAGAEVTAVELDKRLVALGKENAKRYRLAERIEFVEGDVEKFLGNRRRTDQSYSAILADPPRSGLGTVTSLIPQAPYLVLVSCHLASFVRDAKLLQERGWNIEQITPFDMFAQTSHVEIATLLTRNV